jgi:hypothetical protein
MKVDAMDIRAKRLRQLESLKDALYTGVLSVQYEGKSSSFKSTNDLLIAISRLEAELGIGGGIRIGRIIGIRRR